MVLGRWLQITQSDLRGISAVKQIRVSRHATNTLIKSSHINSTQKQRAKNSFYLYTMLNLESLFSDSNNSYWYSAGSISMSGRLKCGGDSTIKALLSSTSEIWTKTWNIINWHITYYQKYQTKDKHLHASIIMLHYSGKMQPLTNSTAWPRNDSLAATISWCKLVQNICMTKLTLPPNSIMGSK